MEGGSPLACYDSPDQINTGQGRERLIGGTAMCHDPYRHPGPDATSDFFVGKKKKKKRVDEMPREHTDAY